MAEALSETAADIQVRGTWALEAIKYGGIERVRDQGEIGETVESDTRIGVSDESSFALWLCKFVSPLRYDSCR